MSKWNSLPAQQVVEKTLVALKGNGMDAMVVENGAIAKEKVLELIPAGSEVLNMTSVTLDTIGVSNEINGSGKYNSVRNKLSGMDRKTQRLEIQKLSTAPEWVVGSIHAVTQDGQVLIASNSGSQLPAYVYGSANVIWVVGVQKIVKNIDRGMRRIRDYTFRLEDERAKKAYGVGSGVNKVLIVNKEIMPGRITMILVKEVLGF